MNLAKYIVASMVIAALPAKVNAQVISFNGPEAEVSVGRTDVSEETFIVTTQSAEEAEAEKPEKQYTDQQLDILSRIICGEAQNCTDEMQLAVGSVFLNRVNDPRFPNSFHEVAFQRRQYACTWDGNYYKTPTEANIKNAIFLLENGSQLPANVIWQAEFKQGKGIYKTIKHGRTTMYFCY